MYEVYGRRGTGSMAVEAVLEEAGVAYRRTNVDRDASGRPAPEYYAINPLGQVPALRLPDGSYMTESAAIVLHLADTHGEALLAPPPEAPERAQFLRWLIFLAANVYMSDLRVYYPDRYTARPADASGVKEAAVAAMAHEWEVYAAALADKPYMLGDRFSALDIYAAMLATWNLDVPAFFRKHPNLAACYDRVVARPAVAQVWQRHGVAF